MSEGIADFFVTQNASFPKSVCMLYAIIIWCIVERVSDTFLKLLVCLTTCLKMFSVHISVHIMGLYYVLYLFVWKSLPLNAQKTVLWLFRWFPICWWQSVGQWSLQIKYLKVVRIPGFVLSSAAWYLDKCVQRALCILNVQGNTQLLDVVCNALVDSPW